MAEAYLSIDGVSAAFGPATVLRDISLGVGRGELVALLGSSGCGKTTLLRSIAGFMPISHGAIRVGGRDIGHLPPERRNTAMVFQSYALWPHMTVAQNIGYGLRLRRMPRPAVDARVAEMLDLLELQGLGQRNVTALSGGQRQRVALGRALAINPELLLLDEPLSNLDARIRVELRHEIRNLQQRLGITAVHVTHDREEAMVIADRLVILEAGAIAQVGSPEEVFHRPASPFVARFMGAGNRIDLSAAADGDMIVLQAAGGVSARLARNSVRLPSALPAALSVFFRSEEARLIGVDEAGTDELVLPGRIAQASYPGGTWRYGIAVGDQVFLVDERRRLAVGDAVGIAIPAAALHLYPASLH